MDINQKINLLKVSISKFLTSQQQERVLHTIFKDKRLPSFRLNNLKGYDEVKVLEELRASLEAISFEKWSLHTSTYSAVVRESDVVKPIFHSSCTRQGLVYFQSLSSMLPALCLDVRPGQKVLDICAAPGGKTTLLAEKMANSGHILATDVDPIRVSKLLHNCELLLGKDDNCVSVVQSDGRYLKVNSQGLPLGNFSDFQDRIVTYFDRVLVDAPCSGSGTWLFQSNKHRKKTHFDLDSTVLLQKQLLYSAAQNLKAGGVLLYSTCSLLPEENEAVVDWLLKSSYDLQLEDVVLDSGFKLLGITPDLSKEVCIPGLSKYQERTFERNMHKCVRILPTVKYEGFFLAKIRKL